MTPIETLMEELRAAGNPRDQKTGPSRELYRRAADALTTSNTALADARAELERVAKDAAIWKGLLEEEFRVSADRAATIETLRAALEPFAKAAGYLSDANGWADTDEIEICYDDGRLLSVIPLSAFRAAAFALSSQGGGNG